MPSYLCIVSENCVLCIFFQQWEEIEFEGCYMEANMEDGIIIHIHIQPFVKRTSM